MNIVALPDDVGVVLKRFYPYKQKLAVLTASKGKILLAVDVVMGQRLWPGMCIRGVFISQKEAIFRGQSIDIISFPSHTMLKHFDWFHQLLEVCYYFIRLESPCLSVYRMLLAVPFLLEFAQNNNMLSSIKLLSISFVLSRLGENPPSDYHAILAIIDKIISAFAQEQFVAYDDLECQLRTELARLKEDGLLNWVYSCLKEHPCSRVFKTKILVP